MTAILFIAGLALLVVGADLLVRGSSRLAVSFGISPLVVGLTVVAFGTSAPELSVSLRASLEGSADIALGNVVGSNICNVLLILGLSAAIAPLVVAQQLVRLDVPLMIGAAMLLLVLALDGSIGRLDGAILVGCLVAYTAFAIRASRKETKEIAAEYDAEFGQVAKPTARSRVVNGVLVLVGFAMLVLGAQWLVDAAVTIAEALGVSTLVIGLTIVAIGTSLPELATSVVAAVRGERDIAVGNVVGSNLFNALGIAGAAGLAAPEGVAVARSMITFDLPFMVATAVACLPIFLTGYRIARWEGLLFLAYYGAYVVYLLLKATEHDALPAFSAMMLFFVMPITAVTLVVLAYRSLRAGRAA
jgi:cation:H+ antiporter